MKLILSFFFPFFFLHANYIPVIFLVSSLHINFSANTWNKFQDLTICETVQKEINQHLLCKMHKNLINLNLCEGTVKYTLHEIRCINFSVKTATKFHAHIDRHFPQNNEAAFTISQNL